MVRSESVAEYFHHCAFQDLLPVSCVGRRNFRAVATLILHFGVYGPGRLDVPQRVDPYSTCQANRNLPRNPQKSNIFLQFHEFKW